MATFIVAATPAQARWVASWESSMANLRSLIPSGTTVRQFARISAGGSQVKVRLSNETGTKPLRVVDGHLAMASTTPGGVDPSTDRALTFHGLASISIPPGGTVTSDPVDIRAPALARIAVSAQYFTASPVPVGHLIASETNYLATGDHAGEGDMAGARPDPNGFGC